MAELSVDTLIKDRYRLKEFKGSGSFGEVWLAQDEILDIEVAIKVYISLDQRGIKEFQNEYKAAYGLHHPNLLVTDYFDVWEQRPFLVMKYCRDGSVASRAGEMTEPELWRFIRDVASGLAYLHGQEPDPIVHQDIKPDNILVDEHGNYLITDFGISRRIRSTMRKQSRRTSTAGAVAYMGPERFSENPTPVMASDIWSLGASIYELATGYLPFDGLGGGHQANGARRPRLQAPWSADLSDTIRACLAQETWDRPRAADLAAYAAAKVEGRRPAAPWVINTSDPSSSSSSTGPSNDPSQIKTSLHNPWPYAPQGPEPQPQGRRTVAQGQEVNPVNVEAPERKRHGFVSFWLYFCLCCNALVAIIFFFSNISEPAYWEWSIMVFGSLMSFYGMWLLLNWRKEGFWLLVVSTALVSITFMSAFNGFVAALFLGLLSTAVSMAIHYGILCIERNGVSTWKWLRYGGPLPALFMLIIMVCVSFFLFFFVGIKRSQLAAEENFENASKGYVEITRMQFGNCDNDGNMLTDYGGTLNASEMRYLKGKFHCTSLADESETVTFKVKIIKPDGTLMSGSSSPSGFTNSMTTTISPTTSSVALNGWGSSSGGSFVAGDYQYEVWVGNRLIYDTTVTIQGAARPATPSHLTVNGKSSTVSVNFTASGGNKQMTVSCPSGSWSTWGIPSFCSVTNKTSTSFTLHCDANTGSSSRSDYMKIIAGSDEVRINISQAAPSSQSNQATRLTVDGKTSVSTSFNASGGTQTFSISTDASSWETWGVPSFCSVTNKTSTSFTLRCDANTSSSVRSDYMKIKAGGKEVRIDITQRGNTSQATRLTVDGKTAVSTSFSASGGTETFYISTDASSWETWGIPTFCSVTNKTSTSFTLRCDANTSTSSRSDYMKIKAGGKEVRIDITQSGKSSSSGSSNKSATINRCWLEHGVTYNGNSGMKVHIDVDIKGMKGKRARVLCFFYKEDDTTAVRNSNGNHVYDDYYLTPSYDSSNWSDSWIFLSYNWMRTQLQGVSGTYAIDVVIWDDNDNQLTRKDNNRFNYTN